jgi:predicted GH43/DUF377 family glycosyl hydrolase
MHVLCAFNDHESQRIIGTYTAYNGHTILPKLISTEDFYTFRVMPLYGAGAQNKTGIIPRKIKGKFAMLSRIDGVKIILCFLINSHNGTIPLYFRTSFSMGIYTNWELRITLD